MNVELCNGDVIVIEPWTRDRVEQVVLAFATCAEMTRLCPELRRWHQRAADELEALIAEASPRCSPAAAQASSPLDNARPRRVLVKPPSPRKPGPGRTRKTSSPAASSLAPTLSDNASTPAPRPKVLPKLPPRRALDQRRPRKLLWAELRTRRDEPSGETAELVEYGAAAPTCDRTDVSRPDDELTRNWNVPAGHAERRPLPRVLPQREELGR